MRPVRQGSAFAVAAELYRVSLARHGVTLKLVPTSGTIDNLARLKDPTSHIDAGFVQAGASTTGVIYPLWSILPKVLRWHAQRRLFRIYVELMYLEDALRRAPVAEHPALLARLAALDAWGHSRFRAGYLKCATTCAPISA